MHADAPRPSQRRRARSGALHRHRAIAGCAARAGVRGLHTAEHLAHWWGPTGFSVTTYASNSGSAASGASYAWARWARLPEPPDVQRHRAALADRRPPRRRRAASPSITKPASRSEADGGKTRLTWRLVFGSIAERDHVAREYGAVEGGQQTIGRLADYVAELAVSAACLRLHYHPLSSYCWKVLIPLYENGDAVRAGALDLATRPTRGAPGALADGQVAGAGGRGARRDRAGVQRHHRLSRPLLSGRGALHAGRSGPGVAHPALGSVLRPACPEPRCRGSSATASARPASRTRSASPTPAGQLATALAHLESEASRSAPGSLATSFGLADCAAAPALYYADRVQPFGTGQRAVRAYLDRLMARPSFARTLKEAEPYFAMFPAG